MTDVRRALIAVSDKRGLVELGAGLAELGVVIVSSGGTAAALAEAGVPVTPVSEIGPYRFTPGTISETLMNDYMKEVYPAAAAAAE